MKLYQIYVHVSLQARAKLSFRARAGAVNDKLDPTVRPGKYLQKKWISAIYGYGSNSEKKEISGWIQQMVLS